MNCPSDVKNFSGALYRGISQNRITNNERIQPRKEQTVQTTISSSLFSSQTSSKMVSLFSSKLLAESGDSSSTSGSATSSGQKRKLVGVRPDNSLSGYSADREESSVSPPYSIDFGMGLNSKSVRELNSCPKRQKRNERQFAAASVKADMARGGLEFSTVNPEIKTTTTLGSVSINLKNVRLVYSKVFEKESTPGPSRGIATLYDYQALALSCWESYPHRSIPANKISTDQDDSDSTSSVSESDTESVTSKNNPEPVISIPPLLEENVVKETICKIPMEMESYGMFSSPRRTMTMSDSLVLTKTPRYELIVYCINSRTRP